jgi:hypothetical protein
VKTLDVAEILAMSIDFDSGTDVAEGVHWGETKAFEYVVTEDSGIS